MGDVPDLPHEVLSGRDPLQIVRALLSYPYINFVSQYFSRVREYQGCLQFVDLCYDIINSRKDQLSRKEYEELDRVLVSYRLASLDGMNEWVRYIELYEDIEHKVSYQLPYWRYEIIKRKLTRHQLGKSTEHLKRHQQERLTDEELDSRYAEMVAVFERIKKRGE